MKAYYWTEYLDKRLRRGQVKQATTAELKL